MSRSGTDGGDEGTAPELPRDVAAEIRQVAHFGRAPEVKRDLLAASEAFSADRLDEATALLESAKRHAPRSPSIRELAGLVHYHRGQWREAARELAAYRRLSGRSDHDPLYADALRALGRTDRALEVLASVDPDEVPEEVYVEALVVEAGILRDAGRPEDAASRLRGGPLHPREVRPHHLRLWYALAEALEEAGERKESRSWWDAIYAEDADFFDVARRRLGVKR
jgi:tetratricopeptide (TPR) repeat protein